MSKSSSAVISLSFCRSDPSEWCDDEDTCDWRIIFPTITFGWNPAFTKEGGTLRSVIPLFARSSWFAPFMVHVSGSSSSWETRGWRAAGASTAAISRCPSRVETS